MPLVRTAIYARVSSHKQRENTSIETQVADCRALAEARGWTVVGEYCDVVRTGREAKRPALQRLLDDVAAKRIDAVVVWKLDRLARNTGAALTMIDEHFKRVLFESVTENLDRVTSGGRFSLAVVAAAAQFSSDQLGERIARVRRHRAEQGRSSGPAPYGYSAHDGQLIPNEDAPTVLLAYELYATGQYGRAKLADELNRRGLTMRDRDTGARYPFGISALGVILKNPTYCGVIVLNGTRYPGNHEALVSQDLWDAVAAVRVAKTNRGGVARSLPPGLLIGVGICAACEARVWNQVVTHRGGGVYHYYRCGGTHRRTCAEPMSRVDQVDAEIGTLIAGLTLPQEALDYALEALAIPPPAPTAPDPATIRAEMERLTEVYIAGRLDKDHYEARYADLTTRLAEAPAASPFDYGAAALGLRNAPYLFASASLDDQRELVQLLFARVLIANHRVVRAEPHPEIADILDVVGRDQPGLPRFLSPIITRPSGRIHDRSIVTP